ncbi:MAG: MBL fold metallo-hydrolase, partial [Myxococcota bacterium]|nr:MBL fold metallo-hydrolase [Myxococcota bacterium]
GPATSRYGGNSSCVEVRAEGGPPLVLDGGTGIRSLGRDLVLEGPQQVHVLFTHFHMDHLFGFPFFGPVYAPGFRVEVGVQAHSEADAGNKLAQYLSGVYHPVRLSDMGDTVSFRPIRPGRSFEMGPYRVQPVSLNHPGGATGYRIDADGRCVVYLTDTAPLARPGEGLLDGRSPNGPEQRVLRALEEADLVIMDTMFSFEEYLAHMTWGHAYPEYAVALCEAAGARRLALFHHSPDRTDDELDSHAAAWSAHQGSVQVSVAIEGALVDLGVGSALGDGPIAQ